MLSDEELKKASELSSISQLSMHEPNERFVLWVIANYPDAFGSQFMLDLIKNPSLTKPDPNSKIGKALLIYVNLKKKKFVKQTDPFKTEITLKGQLYRFVTNPFFPLFALLFAASVTITIAIINHTPSSKQTTTLKDSIPQRQNDSSKKQNPKVVKTDSAKKK